MGSFKERQFLPKQGEVAIPTFFYNLTPKIVNFVKAKTVPGILECKKTSIW